MSNGVRAATLLTLGCLSGLTLALVAAVSWFLGIEAELQLRIVFATQQIGPTQGLLLVIAAIAVAMSSRDWRLRATTAVLGVATIIALAAGVVSILSFPQPIDGLQRAGYLLVVAGTIALCALATWIAAGPWSAQAVAHPSGETPDGGLGGGDGVHEVELDSFLGS